MWRGAIHPRKGIAMPASHCRGAELVEDVDLQEAFADTLSFLDKRELVFLQAATAKRSDAPNG